MTPAARRIVSRATSAQPGEATKGRAAAINASRVSAARSAWVRRLSAIWPGYQDSFISLPHTNVTWFSWLSLIAAMGTGILLGFAGMRTKR